MGTYLPSLALAAVLALLVAPSLAQADPQARAGSVRQPAVQRNEQVAQAEAARADATDVRECVVTGRFLRPDGSPAGAVAIELKGWSRSRGGDFGPGDGWRDLQTTSGSDGRFLLQFVPPGAYEFTFESRLDGLVQVSWRWDGLVEGERRDLGDVALSVGGTIEVRVAAADGGQAGPAWSMHAHELASAAGDGREAVRQLAVQQAEEQLWRIHDLPAGPASVHAYSPMAGWIEGDPVEVVAGATVPWTVVYEGPDPSSRIVVSLSASPVPVEELGGRHVFLTGGELEERLTSKVHQQLTDCYDFTDVPPGEYTVVVEHPSYERWEHAGVRPGEVVEAALRGNAGARVTVLDEDSGEEVRDWSAWVRREDDRQDERLYALVDPGDLPPDDGVLNGLTPRNYTLVVAAPDYPRAFVPLGCLRAGERRDVRVPLSRAGAVSGRVLDADGEPLAHAQIELYRGVIVDRSYVDWWTIWDEERQEYRLARGRGDADGRFRLSTVETGRLLVRAIGSPGRHALHSFERTGGEAHAGIELLLPPVARIVGSIRLPEGVSTERLFIRGGDSKWTPDMPAGAWSLGVDAFVETAVGPDGTFVLEPLPTAKIELALVRKPVSTGFGKPGPETLLEQWVDVPAPGDHRFDFDMVAIWPGTVRVVVRQDGAPVSQIDVGVAVPRNDGWRFADSRRTDAQGAAELRPRPGTYRLQVRDPGRLWLHDAGAVEVRTLEETVRDVDLSLLRGRLRCVDAASGAPLAEKQIHLGFGEPGDVRVSGRSTDRDGVLDLLLPEGTLWLRQRHPGELTRLKEAELLLGVRVDWLATGPCPEVVYLP